jgi:uncharacterized glyoxalase superfamily protein PhnB
MSSRSPGEWDMETRNGDLINTDQVRSTKHMCMHALHLGTVTEKVGWGQQPWGHRGRTLKDRGLRAI